MNEYLIFDVGVLSCSERIAWYSLRFERVPISLSDLCVVIFMIAKQARKYTSPV